MANLAQKIAKLRTMIGVTKDGANKFGGYSYFQIKDIYNASKKPFLDEGVVTAVRQTMEFHDGEPYYTFYLDAYNVEDMADVLTYSMISKHNQLKGCSEGQNSGGNNTYAVKVLMGNLLMLDEGSVDPDAVNKHDGSSVTPKKLSRTDMLKKFEGLDKAKQDEYLKEYSDKEGKTVSSHRFIKAYFLSEISLVEKW